MREILRQHGWPLTAGLLCALLIIAIFPGWFGLGKQRINIQMAPAPAVGSGPVSYAEAVAAASPSVVNIYSTKVVNKPAHIPLPDPTLQQFFAEILPQQQRLESSLGSAVIISSSGYLLTNNHVVEGAEQIVVALKDGRETSAGIVGRDPETDLAVLKIDLPDLPAITLGHSDKIAIGDVVLAIGNPFGVGQTVTMGIVSATGRNQLGINTYEDFIQTDAAINPGNSGGALVDAHGNLLGINTAIFSRSGGSQGIGFAIPAKLALHVMESIVEHGQVVRGWLGIEVQMLTAELAESFGLQQSAGVLVAAVFRDGPAANAGLLPGDVILQIAGVPASDGLSSMNQVARMRPGQRVKILIQRGQQQLELTMQVAQRQ